MSRVSEEEEEDYDYSPDEEDWRKVNKVNTFLIFMNVSKIAIFMC